MKKNKIFIGLALGVGAYLLWNMKRTKTISKTESVNEKDISDVKTGGKKLSDEEKTRLFKEANYYYRGGARPSQDLIDSIKEKRDKALSQINRLGIYEEFSAWRKKENNKNSNLMPPMSINTMEYGKPILLK